ncbi:hypothetical protein DEJ49_33075 [Streptomyces venezuelae]|uniref:Uncharacterized protein n=1 Tax=Streptomyces venezuelae TaxID=54571 RepID=A0A5P2CQJ9_STRVZ|nr:hypothetical protein [Streptomyces venezuelae]QES45176.1 hypothetical protein DEJ49_33075 [Streptomyces venezuelae]
MPESVPEPSAWTFTDGSGIRRQVKVHTTRDGCDVFFEPRFVGDPKPWFDADRAHGDPSAYYADADLVTLGMPVTSWSGFGD